jgi:PHD/YefM family antitoxin component YafN of YafNO toxin-antitoxin module
MRSGIQTAEFMRSMVPVSRFNKGEAAKIFEEVTKTGMKIAVKNNKPACVLLSPERYADMMEEMDDLLLMVEAEKRINEDGNTVSFEDLLLKNNITESDLKGWEDVEID